MDHALVMGLNPRWKYSSKYVFVLTDFNENLILRVNLMVGMNIHSDFIQKHVYNGNPLNV